MIHVVLLREAGRRRAARGAALVALSPLVAACGFGHDGGGTSVFKVKVGECFTAPTSVKAQISDVDQVPCTKPHGKEAYAAAVYTPAAGADGKASSDFPGNDALASFAQGACAQRFTAYVGVSYLDSSLFFTYLAPSARSWQDDDRTVLCFITTDGRPLTTSVKGSKL
ncbi:septum formation family protein [Nocardioides sp. BP30]|uniref:septum formation family protein n=1 Tax=Nocardioides sp. BP30 TaxID=3036374 RepID=UPI00246923CE|nr:septum formation family protein [Nocardioides sp. BP30]WGL52104.1 septum formation family protein [Nocardioides sp. BP30]